ncbi:MAG: hypothetical protein NVSMB39_6520 [Candidatus Saccharimonadales bacterium]
MPYANFFDMVALHVDTDLWWVTLLKLAAWAAIIILVLIKSTDKVYTGTKALRRRGGKVVTYWFGPMKGQPKVYPPGQQWMVPFLHSMWPTSDQARLLELRNQEYERPDGHFMAVTVAIQFKVVDITKALIENESVDALVIALCERHVLKLLSSGVTVQDIDQVFIEHKPALKAAKKLGVELVELSIVSAAETGSSQLASMLVAGGAMQPVVPAIAVQQDIASQRPHLQVIEK